MINSKIEKALNDQINAEYYSAYLYLSMSAYLDNINLKGMANWMRVQYQEEVTHALKMYDFILERGGKVCLSQINTPPTEWSSVLDIFKETLKHEEYVTSLINNLVDISISEKDHATTNFLQWFVNEQVEEEANASEILGQVKMAQESKGTMFMLDKQLGTRVFVDSTLATSTNGA